MRDEKTELTSYYLRRYKANKKEWLKSLSENITYLAEYKGKIVGFGCITPAGYFDKLYVHKDFQFKGIAVAITKKIIAHAKNAGIKKITSEVSITAKPFCEHFGMRVCKEQTKHLRGETFINYLMEGDLTDTKSPHQNRGNNEKY